MSAVFLDSVGLIAVWDYADQWHSAAASAYQRLVVARRKLVTTRFVLLECGNASHRRPYRNEPSNLLRRLELDQALIEPTEQDWRTGWAEYDRGRPGDAGIVDCISFAVMRRLGLTDAFTNDQHFAAAGFTPLF